MNQRGEEGRKDQKGKEKKKIPNESTLPITSPVLLLHSPPFSSFSPQVSPSVLALHQKRP